ncbi:hypothetical protein EG329_000060 [Mollisiaceae sp. DMI_Dod_QoI]|nr:hypothetical protein EG329_000060 [Helotiales sp. DMI_Dod_QoI]
MIPAKVLLFLPIAASISIEKSFEFGQLIVDCITIDNNIKTLTYQIGNWTEAQTFLGALPILQDEQTLDQSIKTATVNAQQLPRLTSSQAANMDALVENYIIPDTAALLSTMKAKKQDFTDVGALGIAQNSISTLRTDQASYSNALLNITPDSNKQQGMKDAATVDTYFADAAAYFAS